MGIVLEDGSTVTLDWVTGRSYSHERDGSICSQAYERRARTVQRKCGQLDRGY